jgi:alanyl-tRNA synthetase
MQGVHDNYDIDLFKDLIAVAAKATGASNLADHSLRVIADHSRACTFLIADGVLPSNEGRGHVLRRIIRRAVRHGYRLGQKDPFFYTLADEVARLMGDVYPYLFDKLALVQDTIRREEEKFGETLERGLLLLDEAIRQGDGTLDGETIFKLYDTYGFPLDLTADIAREQGVIVDFGGFEEAMARQRQRARAAHRFKMDSAFVVEEAETIFVGYDSAECDATVLAIYHEGTEVNAIDEGDEAVIVLDRTPFYAEGGGQAGDAGELISDQGVFNVEDTQKLRAGVFGHKGRLRMGRLTVGDTVLAKIDQERRRSLAANHSATHLLHAALRKVLGPHVMQKGSLVEPERLRFDFSHHKPLSKEEWFEIERMVNTEVWKMERVMPRLMQYEEAIASGALAFFGEKYGSEVRVVRMGDFSTELCGGTHVRNTAEIGFFKIIGETSVASSVRRIEATTRHHALRHVQEQQQELLQMAKTLKTTPDALDTKVAELLVELQQKDKLSQQLKAKLAQLQPRALWQHSRKLPGIPIILGLLDDIDAKSLRLALDELKGRGEPFVAVLASENEGMVNIVVGVSKDVAQMLPATAIIAHLGEQTGVKGGGRPDMAQAGGAKLLDFQKAVEQLPPWLEAKLSSC